MSIDNIVDAIRKTSGSFPNKVAYKHYDDSISYKDLQEKSDALACFLIDELNGDKSPVIVYGQKEIEMIICFLACQKAGHPYIPVECSLPLIRINDIVENSKTRFLFNVHNQELDFPNRKSRAQINDLIFINKGKVPGDEHKVSGNNVFYILYTSGSTGKPKGVQITHDNLRSFIEWMLKIHDISNNIRELSDDDIFMSQANYSFDLSVMNLYPSLVSGSTLYAIDKEMVNALQVLFQHLKKSSISIWVSTPSFAEMCLADINFTREILPNLRMMLFCGETLPNECVSKLHERFKGVSVVNFYGPTEATVAITAIEINKAVNETVSPLPVGMVKENCQICVMDENGNEVTEAETGEIHIIGDTVSPGYLNNPDITKKSFSKILVDGNEQPCYKTGDSGYMKDGSLFYKGRIDFQVKLHGHRIELEDIENNIRKLNYVNSAVVLPVYIEGKINHLHSAITLKCELNESPFKTVLKIKNKLKALVPDYMIPRKFSIRDSLPMNLNGKIDRKALMDEIETAKK